MSDRKPLDEQLMQASMAAYTSREQRAAMRGALGDAAALCDVLAKEIEAANPGRGKGSVSRPGIELAAVAKRCGDAIWAMRDKVTMPERERVAE